MGATTVRQFTNQFYIEECEGHTEEGREPPTYYVVTNVPKFREDLIWLLDRKQRTLYQRTVSRARLLHKRIFFLFDALSRKHGEKKRVRVERVGANNTDGLVDLVEIPIDDPQFNTGSALVDIPNQVTLFRCHDQPTKIEQPQLETLTRTDLEFLHRIGHSSHFRDSSLTRLRDLLIDAKDGTDLTVAAKLLKRRETNLSLRKLRDAADYTLNGWVNMKLALKGKDLRESTDKKGDQSYLEYARDRELISRSDYAQAKAFMFCGNAAVHHNFLAYHRLSAVLFLHWLTDFVDRTIGFHRMPKSRENGTSFSDRYEFSTRPQEYELRRAIFDQLRCMTWQEKEFGSQTNRVYIGENRFSKVDVMKRAIEIIDHMKKRPVRFNRGEKALLSVMNFWAREIRRATYGFTAQDAIRAVMFAHSEFYESKDMNPEHLRTPTVFHEIDPNYLVAVRKKGMTRRRINVEEYGFKELERELEKPLKFVSKVANQYFPDQVQVSAHD